MLRYLCNFVIGFVCTFTVGGAALLATLPLLPSPEDSLARDAPAPEPETAPEVQALPEPREPRPEPQLAWMPVRDEDPAELVLHVEIDSEVTGPHKFYCRLSRAEYDPYPAKGSGSYRINADGIGPQGEGIGFGLSVYFSSNEEGWVWIHVSAYWTRAGGGTGSTSDTLTVSPDRMEIGKLYQHELSPEVTIIYRIARPE